MQVVLTQNIPTLGHKGDVKNVKEGYFRNFLLPHKLAVMATKSKVKEAEEIRKREIIGKERIKEQAKELQPKLNSLTITLTRKAKGKKLYGSVTEKEILNLIEAKTNIKLGKENLKIKESIKTVGEHKITIHLIEGVEAKFTLEVKAEQ